MTGYGWRAHVTRDPNEFARNTVRLFLFERRGDGFDFLMSDGTWKEQPEGTALDSDVGLELPAGAIEAIAEAIAEFQGHTSHAATEAAVLREWLTAERARVDKVLGGGPRS